MSFVYAMIEQDVDDDTGEQVFMPWCAHHPVNWYGTTTRDDVAAHRAARRHDEREHGVEPPP